MSHSRSSSSVSLEQDDFCEISDDSCWFRKMMEECDIDDSTKSVPL